MRKCVSFWELELLDSDNQFFWLSVWRVTDSFYLLPVLLWKQCNRLVWFQKIKITHKILVWPNFSSQCMYLAKRKSQKYLKLKLDNKIISSSFFLHSQKGLWPSNIFNENHSFSSSNHVKINNFYYCLNTCNFNSIVLTAFIHFNSISKQFHSLNNNISLGKVNFEKLCT